MEDLELDDLRREHAVALRAWQFAWSAREEWQRVSFPVREGTPGVVYEHVIQEREALRAAEERAYDRFLSARQVLLEALRSADDSGLRGSGDSSPDERR